MPPSNGIWLGMGFQTWNSQACISLLLCCQQNHNMHSNLLKRISTFVWFYWLAPALHTVNMFALCLITICKCSSEMVIRDIMGFFYLPCIYRGSVQTSMYESIFCVIKQWYRDSRQTELQFFLADLESHCAFVRGQSETRSTVFCMSTHASISTENYSNKWNGKK